MNSWPERIQGLIPPQKNSTRPTPVVIIIYPTVDPQVVIVPIVSSIFVFPIIVFCVICWLRKMAVKRRQRARLTQREDPWNERSCASIVQRSPPLSISIGNGCASRYETTNGDIELATTTLQGQGEEGTLVEVVHEEVDGEISQSQDSSKPHTSPYRKDPSKPNKKYEETPS